MPEEHRNPIKRHSRAIAFGSAAAIVLIGVSAFALAPGVRPASSSEPTREMAAAGEAMTWLAYDAVGCPTLLLRGADSDLLSHATALAMTQRGPKAQLREFAGVGHAPTLVADDQVAAVREFLLS